MMMGLYFAIGIPAIFSRDIGTVIMETLFSVHSGNQSHRLPQSATSMEIKVRILQPTVNNRQEVMEYGIKKLQS